MTVTPSPQSVAVPRELLDPIAAMWREASCHDLVPADDKHAWGFNRADLYWGDIRKLAEAATPAPSSLAGGEVMKALLDHIDIQTCMHENTKRGGTIWTICEDCGRKWADDEGGFKPRVDAPAVAAARECLTALSPEAPARDVGFTPVKGVWKDQDRSRLERVRAFRFEFGGSISDAILAVDEETARQALTPRHEAPADPFAAEDACLACHEAPAEGAGEFTRQMEILRKAASVPVPDDDSDFTVEKARRGSESWRVIASNVLREYDSARSSAPEARAEALGNLLAVIHGDGGHRAMEVGTKQAALEAEKIVAGLLAAPSADKLRIAVEQTPDAPWIDCVQKMLDRFDRAKGKGGYPTANEREAMRRCMIPVHLLATLKAEGC